jgi:hypothetical protein
LRGPLPWAACYLASAALGTAILLWESAGHPALPLLSLPGCLLYAPLYPLLALMALFGDWWARAGVSLLVAAAVLVGLRWVSGDALFARAKPSTEG